MWRVFGPAHYSSEVKEVGYTVLREFIPLDKVEMMAEHFRPLLEKRMSVDGPDRGPGRYYATLPFNTPFADQDVFAHPFLLEILEEIVGKDFVMCQLATDTPIKGSDYQTIHRDAEGLFCEGLEPYLETPTFQLAVNFPLCDIANSDIGPLEISKRTHLLTSIEQESILESEGIELEALYMNKGDLLIRDVRCLHRGTPNVTDHPRPMVVMGYSRKWLRRPEVGVLIPQSVYDSLDSAARHLLRYEMVLSDDHDALTYTGHEGYDADMLKKTSGNSIKL